MPPRERNRLRHWLNLLFLVAVPALPLSGDQSAPAAATGQEKPIRLSRADAARLAQEARQKVSVEMPPGVELTLWAPERLVTDPIAIDVDARGIVYVTSSSRNNLPLDIRRHPDWYPIVHTLRSVEDLRQFYRREMAPAKSGSNGWIEDLNKDGSRDIRDLAELKERLHRLQDTDGDGLADVSQIMIEGFNEDPVWDVAGGLLYHEGDLFLGVPPGVYRLRDTNGDGVVDQQTPISEGYNTHPAFGGHGISGVTIGPDGRLYWEVGDIGLDVVDKTGRRWAYPNQGAVMRSNLDGSDFEVFATGIRNLQEFSFDEHGNLISVDNDGDHQGETERLVYIPYGSDSGWRSNWQYGKYTDSRNNRYNVWMDEGLFKPRHAGQGTHIIPPVAPYHAGPSGMAYNPGTALSDEWRNHFFVSSFPGAPGNARVYAFTLKQDGAGFALASDKVLLRGILTVGMKFGPDGALYLTDWITGWDSKNNGRLWKLDAPQVAGSAIRKEVQALLIEDFSGRTTANVTTLLGHADMRIRQKAQFDLVRRSDAQSLLTTAREYPHRIARLHGLWGLAQLARTDVQHAAPLVQFLTDSDAEVRAQAAKMIGDVRYAAGADPLLPLLKDSSARVRFFAAEALGRIKHKPAAGPLVEMLAENNDRDVYLRHAGSLALSQLGDPSSLDALSRHSSRGVRIAAIVALRRMRHPGVARFLEDAEEQVVTEAARAINDDGSIEAAVPALARVLGEKRFTSEPLLRRAINANLRVGTTEALARVAAFAADTGRADTLRVEAVAALGVWPSPSPMDRVDGIYFDPPSPAASARQAPPSPAASGGQALLSTSAGQAGTARLAGGTRDATAARAAVQHLVETLAKPGGPPPTDAMKVALADAAGLLEVKTAAPILLAQLRSDPSQDVRLSSLRALRALKVGDMDEVMRIALDDKDSVVRRAALGILPTLPMTNAAKVQHLASVITNGSIGEKQGAFEVLGTLKTNDARRLLGKYLDDLIAGKMAPELQLDVVDAIQSGRSSALEGRLEAYRKTRGADSLVTAFRDALLRGGDARRGQRVLTENPAAECTRCHSLGGRGADVGPNLTNIGSTLTREQLLESLLEPNARIAPGFGTVGVTLRDGQRVDGTLREETEAHLVVLTGTPSVERRMAKSEIAARTNPVSAMPPFGLILKPREIRDLVEFLANLK